MYRYADIQTVLGDPHTYSSDASVLQTMATMDPPRHTQLRRLVARAFSAKLIADLEPRIVSIVDGLLDRARQRGALDVVNDLAFPLPVTVIAELLGLPVEDQLKFKAWSIPSGQRRPRPNCMACRSHRSSWPQWLSLRLISCRWPMPARPIPRADLVSGLVHAEIDGQRLTDEEIVSTCRLLLIAGFETSANLIGNTLHLLLLHPEVLARVREAACADRCRHRSTAPPHPFQFLARKTLREVGLAGQQIPQGQLVLLMLGSGNRDETAFERADEFDPWRPPVRHLSFGHGIHYCLGAGLGRMEARIAVTRLLAQFQGLRFIESSPPVPLQSVVLFGLQRPTCAVGPRTSSSRLNGRASPHRDLARSCRAGQSLCHPARLLPRL